MTTQGAWDDATRAWAEHHDATNPVRPPAGALSEPERQRYLTQARRLGLQVERLRAEVDRLRRELDMANRSGGFYAGALHPAHRVDL